MWNQLVVKYWNSVPQWARVVAFFVALTMSVYLTLVPQFVNGYVYFKDEDNGKWAYRGGEVITSVGGRDFKYLINENGYFSVPMISKLPKNLRLGFIHQDTGGRYDVAVPFSSAVASMDALEFEVKLDPPTVMFVVAFQERALEDRLEAVWETIGSRQVNAAELRLPEGVSQIQQSEARSVREKVIELVAREAKMRESSIDDTTEFTWANGFPYIIKIRTVDAIEKVYGFRIPDDHWQRFRTVGEIVDYTQKRIALDRFESSKNVTWPEYQNKVQRKDGPLFVK